jgi:PIN domain nuclease of toxin-antitoxin system
VLWAAGDSDRLSLAARELQDDPTKGLFFCSAVIWEVFLLTADDMVASYGSPVRLVWRSGRGTLAHQAD